MSKPSKGAIRKTIHRTTCEVPLQISEGRTKVLRHSLPTQNNKATNVAPCKDDSNKPRLPNKKYHVPELNTSIALNKKMEEIKSKKSVHDLTPRTKEFVAIETTKRLNFPPDKAVYKNLIPININDSVLMIGNDDYNENQNHKPKTLRKKYLLKQNKDPIPELADFLEPIKPLIHKLPPYDKKDVLLKPNNNFYPLIYKICTEYHPSY